MARNVSDEELQLKKRARRRLVGAIVLVTAVAVVLPMILDSEPKPASQSINIQIPSPEAGVLSGKPEPLKPAEKPAVATAESEPPKVEAKTESKPEPKVEAKAEIQPEKPTVFAKAEPKMETTAEETKAAPKSQSAPAPAKTKAPATGSFVIQVAALSDAAKAKELQAKIAGGGLKAYTEVVQTSKGPVTRVRVGPYASREAAEKARPLLQKLQLDGKVIPR
jgi:DedD protein